MKVLFEKTTIKIIPESPADEVYLETVLGLRKKDDLGYVKRVAPFDLDYAWAYAEVGKGTGDA